MAPQLCPTTPTPPASGNSAVTNKPEKPTSTGAAESQANANSEAGKGTQQTQNQQSNVRGGIGDFSKLSNDSLGSALHRAADPNFTKPPAGSQSTPPPDRPKTQAEINHDLQIVEYALNQREKSKPISKKVVGTAYDPGARTDLLIAAGAQQMRRYLEQEDARLTQTLAALTNMAALTSQRLTALDSVPAEGGNAANLAGRAPSATGGGPTISSTKFGDLADARKRGDGLNKDEVLGNNSGPGAHSKDTSELTDKSLAGMSAEDKTKLLATAKNAVLREKLRRQLARAGAGDSSGKKDPRKSADSVDAGDHFAGNLPTEGLTQANVGTNEGTSGNMASQIANSMLDSAKSDFHLAGSETESAVKQIISDHESAAGSQADPAILGTDSLSLFERVKSAHKNCMQRACVRSSRMVGKLN
ncbi:MAG TPA: hypothetical protein VIH99_05650 [Bdellovibrionota bacterium]